jgi:hypothetical protein
MDSEKPLFRNGHNSTVGADVASGQSWPFPAVPSMVTVNTRREVLQVFLWYIEIFPRNVFVFLDCRSFNHFPIWMKASLPPSLPPSLPLSHDRGLAGRWEWGRGCLENGVVGADVAPGEAWTVPTVPAIVAVDRRGIEFCMDFFRIVCAFLDMLNS